MRRSLIALMLIFTPLSYAENQDDPWEGWNRGVFEFNETVDKYAARPLAMAYRNVTPQAVDNAFSNVFGNLGEPLVIINDLFQLKFAQAASDTGRFLINSTIGLLGIFDVASHIGLEKHDEDIGQTLGYWGLNSGPYVVLPFLGPSTVRDASGLAIQYSLPSDIDVLKQTMDESQVFYSPTFLKFLDLRADLVPAEGLISGDKYSFVRSLYLQRRQYLINDGKVEDEFSDEFEDEWEDDEFESESIDEEAFSEEELSLDDGSREIIEDENQTTQPVDSNASPQASDAVLDEVPVMNPSPEPESSEVDGEAIN